MNAQIQKDGRQIDLSPKLFDASGVFANECDDIWGGSTLRVLLTSCLGTWQGRVLVSFA